MVGFDLATGLGTPQVNNLVPDLVNQIAGPASANSGTNPTTPATSDPVTGGITLAPTGRSALRQAVKASLTQNGKPVTPPHSGQQSHAVTETSLALFITEFQVGTFSLPGNSQTASATTNVIAPAGQHSSNASSPLGIGVSGPSSHFYPLTPAALANSYYDGQGIDFMPPADMDNLGEGGKGMGTDKQRAAPRPEPKPAKEQAAISAAACDACFAEGNWYSAVSDGELDALAGVPVLGQKSSPAAALAGVMVVLGTYWGVRRDESQQRRHCSPRLTKN
jgi:hypothetical protein